MIARKPVHYRQSKIRIIYIMERLREAYRVVRLSSSMESGTGCHSNLALTGGFESRETPDLSCNHYRAKSLFIRQRRS